MELQHKHAYRLIYKIRNHRELIDRFECYGLEDDPEIILVSYGTPSRVVKSAVKAARERGIRAGGIRLISLWPFPDQLFSLPSRTCRWNSTGTVSLFVKFGVLHQKPGVCIFLGKCGELPTGTELQDAIDAILKDQPRHTQSWKLEAW